MQYVSAENSISSFSAKHRRYFLVAESLPYILEDLIGTDMQMGFPFIRIFLQTTSPRRNVSLTKYVAPQSKLEHQQNQISYLSVHPH